LFLESKKSQVGRRGIAPDSLRQAWNRKRRSQFLPLIFLEFSEQVGRDFAGANLQETPSMIG